MILRPGPAWGTALTIVLITGVPILVVGASVLLPNPPVWDHLLEVVLPEVVANTLWLVLGVGLGVTVLGGSLGWLTATCEFPGRRFFSWALLLPLALPAYVSAFVWLGLLDFTGTLPSWLREVWGIRVNLPIRSTAGVIVVMSLALYPYVYLTARAAFTGQDSRLVEAAQSLGFSRAQAFWRVSLPLARQGIVAGLLLALMETLADFGTVAVFNYDTFTTAIYKAWFALFSLPAAAKLASYLVAFVFVVAILESRARASMQQMGGRALGKAPRLQLRGGAAMGALLWAGGVFGLAFVIPSAQLMIWAVKVWSQDLDMRYLAFAWHSLSLSALGASLVCALALLLAYAQRSVPSHAMRLTTRAATLGYALPGSVLAVGFYLPIAWLDNQLIDRLGVQGQVLGGTLLVMLLAYSARFLAVAFGPVDAGLGRVSRRLDEAAATMGVSGAQQLRRVHLPMLRVSVLSAYALVFVDIMKELPITLMTRPFGWDTLAVRVFEMTSESEWERAALPALAIALVGLLPVALLIRSTDHAHT